MLNQNKLISVSERMCMKQVRVYILATELWLDTMIYKYMAVLLHISAFFGHVRGGTRHRWIQWCLGTSCMWNSKVKYSYVTMVERIKSIVQCSLCIILVVTGPAENALFQASATEQIRTALFWVVTQRVAIIPCRRFGTTYRFHLQG